MNRSILAIFALTVAVVPTNVDAVPPSAPTAIVTMQASIVPNAPATPPQQIPVCPRRESGTAEILNDPHYPGQKIFDYLQYCNGKREGVQTEDFRDELVEVKGEITVTDAPILRGYDQTVIGERQRHSTSFYSGDTGTIQMTELFTARDALAAYDSWTVHKKTSRLFPTVFSKSPDGRISYSPTNPEKLHTEITSEVSLGRPGFERTNSYISTFDSSKATDGMESECRSAFFSTINVPLGTNTNHTAYATLRKDDKGCDALILAPSLSMLQLVTACYDNSVASFETTRLVLAGEERVLTEYSLTIGYQTWNAPNDPTAWTEDDQILAIVTRQLAMRGCPEAQARTTAN